MTRIAIDFGTTNTVVAAWREATNAPEILRLPGLSAPAIEGLAPLVPSLLYVLDGQTSATLAGQTVRDEGYDLRGDERLFASFKRGIAAASRPLRREIDGALWAEDTAGRVFLSAVVQTAAQVERQAIADLTMRPGGEISDELTWVKHIEIRKRDNSRWQPRGGFGEKSSTGRRNLTMWVLCRVGCKCLKDCRPQVPLLMPAADKVKSKVGWLEFDVRADIDTGDPFLLFQFLALVGCKSTLADTPFEVKVVAIGNV